jgi:2,5-diketo-D-gluconate reductase A
MSEASAVGSADLPGGVTMPLVGFGTWRLRGRAAYDAVRAALDAGYRHLDTATFYGNETEVGRAVADSGVARDRVFITTKLPAERAGREAETLADSVRALGGHVDLWLIHWPPGGQAAPAVWRHLLAARDAGSVRAVGVSNYDPDQIDELVDATGEAPAVDQVPWSPGRHDPRLLDRLRQRGVVVEGYRPLKDTDLDDPVLAAIAARHGVDPARVVLRWHVQHGIVVIPKSARPERIRANIDLAGFTLDAAEMAQIDALSRLAGP